MFQALRRRVRPRVALSACFAVLLAALSDSHARDALPDRVQLSGRSPTSEECGACHVAIYREYVMGFGAELQYKGVLSKATEDKFLSAPANVSSTLIGGPEAVLDPYPIHAENEDARNASCKYCHTPRSFAIPDLDRPAMGKPDPRPEGEERGGVRCISCHLTPEGAIRTSHAVQAPHETVQDARIHTSAMCAYCHSLGAYTPGKQTQTFVEWREDYYKPGLGRQHCQDCHMPRTLRKTAEAFDVPVRAVARHLWIGGHAPQRVQSAATAVIVQPVAGESRFELHVMNVGAGHSVPSGFNRRALYVLAEVEDEEEERIVASREWLFAPWYGDRPDDRASVQDDPPGPERAAAGRAHLQGPHEPILRAGETRTLPWSPALVPGSYTLRARLIYDLNRYNDWSISQERAEIVNVTLPFQITRP